MTYIAPCHDCPLKQGCTQRDEFRRRTKGLNAASIKFRCDKLTAELRPGRRIELGAAVVGVGWGYDGEEDGVIRRDVPATITGATGTRFTCVIDPGHITENPDGHSEETRDISALRFRRYQRHSRIRRFLDEPDATLCEHGKRVMRGGTCDRPKDGVCYCDEAKQWVTP